MERILISACLLGTACRYDGESRECAAVKSLLDNYELIPVCPEQLGGLPTPRPASERTGDKVMNTEGVDVTMQYRRGAEEALKIARYFGCKKALLKAKSPSCGNREIYDGTFTGTRIPGKGCTAELLEAEGILVYNEEELEEL